MHHAIKGQIYQGNVLQGWRGRESTWRRNSTHQLTGNDGGVATQTTQQTSAPTKIFGKEAFQNDEDTSKIRNKRQRDPIKECNLNDNNKQKETTTSLSGHVKKTTNSTEDSTWTKVEPKKRLQKRAWPDSLMITKTSKLTYAEILRRVKADASPTDLSANDTRKRRYGRKLKYH